MTLILSCTSQLCLVELLAKLNRNLSASEFSYGMAEHMIRPRCTADDRSRHFYVIENPGARRLSC